MDPYVAPKQYTLIGGLQCQSMVGAKQTKQIGKNTWRTYACPQYHMRIPSKHVLRRCTHFTNITIWQRWRGSTFQLLTTTKFLDEFFNMNTTEPKQNMEAVFYEQ